MNRVDKTKAAQAARALLSEISQQRTAMKPATTEHSFTIFGFTVYRWTEGPDEWDEVVASVWRDREERLALGTLASCKLTVDETVNLSAKELSALERFFPASA